MPWPSFHCTTPSPGNSITTTHFRFSTLSVVIWVRMEKSVTPLLQISPRSRRANVIESLSSLSCTEAHPIEGCRSSPFLPIIGLWGFVPRFVVMFQRVKVRCFGVKNDAQAFGAVSHTRQLPCGFALPWICCCCALLHVYHCMPSSNVCQRNLAVIAARPPVESRKTRTGHS